MPTARPRHMLTETEEVAAALADAARRWPGRSPAELLRKLILEGHAVLESRRDAERAAVAATAGAWDEFYETGLRERLREEWPE